MRKLKTRVKARGCKQKSQVVVCVYLVRSETTYYVLNLICGFILLFLRNINANYFLCVFLFCFLYLAQDFGFKSNRTETVQ